ncbi:MAG: MFS transporter [Bacillota bacterium]|nr:MFS transporter [Bacillota bacterium]
MKQNRSNKYNLMIGMMIVLIACNLRAPITGVGSLVNVMRDDLDLSPGMAGFLTTLPVLAFAAVSPVVSTMARKIGAGNLLLLSLLVLNGGILIRSFCGDPGLFFGTAVIGLGIGVGNVLLPAVIKSEFPHRIAFMTSLYTAVMQVVSAVSTAVSVPLAASFGWKGALLLWIVTGVAAFFCSIPGRRLTVSEAAEAPLHKEEGQAGGSLYRKPLAWWITAYMGVQSLLFYSFIAWLSPIMQDRGYGGTEAGYILSVYVILGIIGSCALPLMMAKNRTQSATGIQLGVLYLVGMLLMLLAKGFIPVMAGVVLCGFCSGGCISFAMALFGLHTSNGQDASKISGMAQSLGYLIAAVGPVLLGKVYDLAGGWSAPLVILCCGAVLLIFMGKIVGREEIL